MSKIVKSGFRSIDPRGGSRETPLLDILATCTESNWANWRGDREERAVRGPAGELDVRNRRSGDVGELRRLVTTTARRCPRRTRRPRTPALVEALAARGGQLQRARPMRQTSSRGRWRSVLRGVGVPARAPSTAGLNGSIQWDSSPLAVVVRIERGFEILAGVVRTCAGPDILEPGSCGTASDDSNRSMPCWSDTSSRWSDGPEARRRSGSAALRHHERGRGRAG